MANVNFNDIITFTRASGGGRFNAAGQYEWLAANEPRIDYDPVTKECRGLLIEEQRTNLLLQSGGFESAVWTRQGVGVTANVAIAPDGALTAGKLIPNSGAASAVIRQIFTATDATVVTLSIFFRAAEFNTLRLGMRCKDGSIRAALFNASSGVVSGVPGGYTASMQPVGNGFFRSSFSGSVAIGPVVPQISIYAVNDSIPNTVGDGTSGIYIWGAQVEAGAFPTSYIPTTTAQVTRAADLCSVNNLTPWYRANEGTLAVEWSLPVNTYDNNQLAAFGSAAAPSMAIRMGVNNGRRVRAFAQDASGVLQYSVDCPVEASRTTGGSAFAYKMKDDFAASSAGSLNRDVSGDISSLSVDALRVGNNSGSYANGHIRRIRYIPRRISDTDLQALTAL